MYCRSPLYLQFRQSGYTFRYSLPKDVRSYFKRNEIKIALRTCSFSRAKLWSRLLSCKVEWLIEDIRNHKAMGLLTDEQIAHLVQRYFKSFLELDELWRVSIGWSDGFEAFIQGEKGHLMEQLGKSDYSKVSDLAQGLTAGLLDGGSPESFDESFDKNDYTFKKLCRELIKGQIKIHEIWEKRQRGDYSNEPTLLDHVFQGPPGPGLTPLHLPIQQPPKILNQAVPAGTQGRKLSELIELYAEECRATNRWKGRTETESLSTFQLVIRILGDVSVNTIKRENIAQFKSTILKLPPNLNKLPAYRKKEIPEVIRYVEKHKRRTLSLVTVKKYLMRINALFDYAEIHGYIDSNPAKGISINVKNADCIEIGPFSEGDLEKLFNCDIVINDKFRYAWQPWILILALFTGCRLEEMAQLYLADIFQKDGFWILDINDKQPDKELKTESSKRLIPLHPFLIDDLDLPGFMEKLKRRGHKRLFPDLSLQSKGGYGRAVTRWFPNFREKAGIPQFDDEEQKKVFHSFRHTFCTMLKFKDVIKTMTAELMGHAVVTLPEGVYAAKYPIAKKYNDAILKLEYDFNALSNIKSCIRKL